MRFDLARHGSALLTLALISACAAQSAQTTPAPVPPMAVAAPAQPQPPAALASVQRFRGEVTAASATSLSVRGEDGQTNQIALTPQTMIVTSHAMSASDIHPGDFVATANTNVDDHTGRSVELRVFPPGVRLGEGSYPMQQPNTTMTNATVAEVANVTDGRDLLVRYPGGERHIVLPANVTVIGQSRASAEDIHAGAHVTAIARPDANGALTGAYIMLGEPGAH